MHALATASNNCPQDIAVAEAAVAIDREGRVIGHFVLEIETAEPAIGEMKLDLLAQLALMPDAVAVADNQHSQHQFRINRRSADLTIERLQLATELSQYTRHDRIDPAQQMAFGDQFIEVERVKQPALIARLLAHHHQTPLPTPPSNGITAQPRSRALFQQHRPTAEVSWCQATGPCRED